MAAAFKARLEKIRHEFDGLLEQWDAMSNGEQRQCMDELRFQADRLDDLHSDFVPISHTPLILIGAALFLAVTCTAFWP